MIDVVIEPLKSSLNLEPVWRELEARADAPFFLTWNWMGPWLATVEETPFLMTAWAGDRRVGLAFLMLANQRRHHWLSVPTVFLNRTGDEARDVVTIEFNDVLAERGLEQDVRRAVLARLTSCDRLGSRRYAAIAWYGALDALTADFDRSALPWRVTQSTGSAFVDLNAVRTSGRPYLDHLSSSTRRQIRRTMALYEERGALELEAARDVDEALHFFDLAGELHQQRWRARGKPGAFAFPFYVAFHRQVIRRGLPRGAIELVRVRVGTVPIGYLYNFIHEGHVYYYFSGFRYEDDNKIRPGLITHVLCIERHIKLGNTVYDFMGGNERYKRSLGCGGPDMIGVVLEHPRPLLKLEAALRYVRHRLPKLGTPNRVRFARDRFR